MRKSLLALSVLLALASGCEVLGFDNESGGGDGDGDPSSPTGTGANQGSGGYVSGNPGTGGSDDAPQFGFAGLQGDPNGPSRACPSDAAGVLDAPRPTIVDAPRILRGYASAQYARYLLLGSPARLPEPALLRPDDFLAYYGDRSLPGNGGLVADGRYVDVHLVVTTPTEPYEGYLELRVLRPAPIDLPDVHYVIVADVSPSMDAALALEEQILEHIGDELTDTGDSVSLVTFAGGTEAQLVRAPGDALKAAAALLEIRGGNDLEGALKAAVTLAQDLPDGAAAVPTELILLTDGGADFDLAVFDMLSAAQSQGIRSSVVQVAKGSRATEDTILHDAFLDGFAASGGGASLFIGSSSDAEVAFRERFDETFRTAFTDTTLSVTLPGGFQSLEDLSGTDTTAGAEGGYDRWHSTRHHVSICAATKGAIAPASNLTVEVTVLDDGALVGQNTSFGSFNPAFATASLGSLLEDAILTTVQYLRAGAPGDHSAADALIQLARMRADCADDPVPAATKQACASLDELENLLAATQGL